MQTSERFGFVLPSRDNPDDIADINQISDNFRIIDNEAVKKAEGKQLSQNDFTNNDKKKLDSLSPMRVEFQKNDYEKIFGEVEIKENAVSLKQGEDLEIHSNVTELLVRDGEVNLNQTVDGEEFTVKLNGIKTPDGTDPTQAVNVQYLKGRSEEVDPVFENNSWGLIKWICQHDDPSKYWKAGDYKMLQLGEKYIGENLETDTYGTYGAPYLIGKVGQILILYDINLIASLVGGKTGTYVIKTGEGGLTADPYTIEDEGGEVVWGGSYSELHINFSDITNEADQWTLVIAKEKVEYPLQILGFNHDKVTNPYEYGKQRAGMTLLLGCSRSQYGDTKASLFDGKIEGLMAANGKHYKSPNRVKSDFSEGVTNWEESGARLAVQTMFDNTEIRPYMVKAQKYTSQYFNSTNHWAAPMLTEDLVSFLSEWEVFGMQVHAPAQEGEQYEFFKDGYSKFMWHKDMLSGTVEIANLWLRSAQGSAVNPDNPNSTSACAVLLKVINPPTAEGGLSVNYSPTAAASEKRAGLIAPCIYL